MESIVDTDCDEIGLTREQGWRDVKRESGVALTRVLRQAAR